MQRRSVEEPANVLYRIKRGLAGYVSYLAACEMNEAFSEYVLYEPTLRILTARGFTAQCEVPCPGLPKGPVGDGPKLDFVANKDALSFAIEAKWARSRSVNLDRDLAKLRAYRQSTQGRAFLCVFGRKKHISHLRFPTKALREKGKPIFAEFGVTRYGCRVFELQPRPRLAF